MAASDLPASASRSTRRSQGATPVRDVSPVRRTTRAGSTAGSTPGARRSTRTVSKKIEPVQDVVTNNALPEIQTRQSYAYGSSKAPLLPEQLHAQETLSMNQVAARMDSAIQNAERNLIDHLAEVGEVPRPESRLPKEQTATKEGMGVETKKPQVEKQAQKPPGAGPRNLSPLSHTTEAQKHHRTAAWASSLDSSQLEDIPEESSNIPDSPETRRTEPSSFPSGIFDHSYNYERGVRAPRASEPHRTRPLLKRVWSGTTASFSKAYHISAKLENQVADWLWRLFGTLWKVLMELPESTMMSVLMKSFLIVCMTGAMSLTLCSVYRNYLCDPYSISPVAQTLQSLCGTCISNNGAPPNVTLGNVADMSQLTKALKQINSQISSLEARLGQRIEVSHMAMQSEIDELRSQQGDLTSLLETIGTSPHTDVEVPSPFIPKVNFFSPGLGAMILPEFTSPTHSKRPWLPVRITLNMFGINKYDIHGPLTALLPWQDVGDCWCASEPAAGQDIFRVGVEVREMIYPTELVVEHPPLGAMLEPGRAPRNIEVWADFSHLTLKKWAELGLESMQRDKDDSDPPLGTSYRWAKVASMVYDVSSNSHHVQTFKLDVNQLGNLRYAAQSFVIRVKTNYGADYSCLYRLRLHGVPFDQSQQEINYTETSAED